MKNKRVYGLVGVAALAVVGGTFAYYNATQTFNNAFDTSNYGTYAVEQFNPSDGHNWEPGAEVPKKVYATNTGNADVWVRIKLDEYWTNLKAEVSEKSNIGSDLWTTNPTSGKTAGSNQVPGEKDEVEKVDATTNGYVKDDTSVVYKKFLKTEIADGNKGESKGDKDWYYKDGWFYYTTKLAPNDSTNGLLDSVTLCQDADMGYFEDNKYYMVGNKDLTGTDLLPYTINTDGTHTMKNNWHSFDSMTLNANNQNVIDNEVITIDPGKTLYTYKTNELVNRRYGYANANYRLDITVQFVQTAKEAAVAAQWDPEVVDLLFPNSAQNNE